MKDPPNGTFASLNALTRNAGAVGGIQPSTGFQGNFGCMKKVMMEEETEWDYEEQCHHVTTQNCYEAFRTEFKPQKLCKRILILICIMLD